jgi:hypothetical protein
MVIGRNGGCGVKCGGNGAFASHAFPIQATIAISVTGRSPANSTPPPPSQNSYFIFASFHHHYRLDMLTTRLSHVAQLPASTVLPYIGGLIT